MKPADYSTYSLREIIKENPEIERFELPKDKALELSKYN